jgi:hypothetical protein
MGTPNSISDLMALATIRRLLLELGHPLQPERPGTLIGPLELWMHEPRPQLDGQSPLHALAGPAGEQRVRDCLVELIALNAPPSQPSDSRSMRFGAPSREE